MHKGGKKTSELLERKGIEMDTKYNIKQAIIHIAYTCEHQCPMCYADSNNEREQPDFSQLCKVINRLLELKINDITFVGGDPAVYGQIVELAAYAKNNGAMLSVLSNTLDFNGKKNDVLKYIDTYEGTVHHSNSRKHDTFCGVDGAYDKLVGNLKFFSDHGKSVGLAINIIPYNYSVLAELVESVINKGINIDHLVMQRIIQFGRATGRNNFEITKKMLSEALEQVEWLENKYRIKVIFEDPVPLCAIEKKYYRYMHPCEWGTTKVSVDYKGKLSRCGADVYHSFGSIFDDVDTLWNSDNDLKKFREKKYLPIKCQMCDLLDKCGGGCPISRNPEQGFAANYLSGDCEKKE